MNLKNTPLISLSISIICISSCFSLKSIPKSLHKVASHLIDVNAFTPQQLKVGLESVVRILEDVDSAVLNVEEMQATLDYQYIDIARLIFKKDPDAAIRYVGEHVNKGCAFASLGAIELYALKIRSMKKNDLLFKQYVEKAWFNYFVFMLRAMQDVKCLANPSPCGSLSTAKMVMLRNLGDAINSYYMQYHLLSQEEAAKKSDADFMALLPDITQKAFQHVEEIFNAEAQNISKVPSPLWISFYNINYHFDANGENPTFSYDNKLIPANKWHAVRMKALHEMKDEIQKYTL